MNKYFPRFVMGLVLLVSLVAIATCRKEPTPVQVGYKSVGGHLNLDVKVTDLKESKSYVLSLNGKVGQDGNDSLKHFGVYGPQGVYDFDTVSTDQQGNLLYQGGVALPDGKYDVTFLIKDKDADYKPIIVRDHWRFEITN